MNCPNCQTQLSCGCQKRKASDGKEVCSNCITLYEGMLMNNSKVFPQTDTPSTAPTNITITYTQNPASQ